MGIYCCSTCRPDMKQEHFTGLWSCAGRAVQGFIMHLRRAVAEGSQDLLALQGDIFPGPLRHNKTLTRPLHSPDASH